MNVLAAALVQIIGLAVLRNECEVGGMHVILPSVGTASSHVESHSAILVFREDARVHRRFVDRSEWQSFPLKPMPGYSYVKLTRDRVGFIVNGANGLAEIPAGLPHLERSCPLMEELSQGYQPPEYSAAAAVVMIPNGTTSACRSANGRIDTRVWMNNTGNFHVVAGNKRITLRDDAVVMIVNLPTTWVEDAPEETKFPPELHSRVYFHMASMAPAARDTCALKPAQDVESCNSPRADVPVLRRPRVFHFLRNLVVREPPDYPEIGALEATTFECSNTQWP
jgi:hypothetical protein